MSNAHNAGLNIGVTNVKAKKKALQSGKHEKSQKSTLGSSGGMSKDAALLECGLTAEYEKQIANIMNWRLPPNFDSDSEEEEPNKERLFKSVAFEESPTESPKRRKPRRTKGGRRSVRPILEREGDLSPREQLRRGKAYASFFERIEDIEDEDEEALMTSLADGLRVWLKFGTTVTGTTAPVMSNVT